MRTATVTFAIAAAILAGCGADEGTQPSGTPPASVTTGPATTPTSVEDTGEATTTPEPPPDPGDLPGRADMESWTVILAEGVFIDTVRDDPPEDLGRIDDAALIAAGNTACNAMDNGAEFRQVLISVAAVMPELQNADTTGVIAGAAAGTLCPEHLDYLD